jgi:hypothetical protein
MKGEVVLKNRQKKGEMETSEQKGIPRGKRNKIEKEGKVYLSYKYPFLN